MTKAILCPFCGAENISVFSKEYGLRVKMKRPSFLGTVQCSLCGASITPNDGFAQTKEEAEERAIKAWNCRWNGTV